MEKETSIEGTHIGSGEARICSQHEHIQGTHMQKQSMDVENKTEHLSHIALMGGTFLSFLSLCEGCAHVYLDGVHMCTPLYLVYTLGRNWCADAHLENVRIYAPLP